MLTRTAIAAAAIGIALFSTAPAARADFGAMMAHNYEMLMKGMERRHTRVSVQRVLRKLDKRGYSNFRVLRSGPDSYRIFCYRDGRPFVVRASARSGRIISVRRG